MAPEKPRDVPAESTETATPTGPKICWDDSNMKSAYANFCNVASTREEVVLLFGMNQAWQAGQAEIPIQLTDRLIISPILLTSPSRPVSMVPVSSVVRIPG